MHTLVVLAEFQKVGKEVFIGPMLTGLVQCFLATLIAICSLGSIIGPAVAAAARPP